MVECVRLRDEISPNTLLIGNGDIKTKQQGEEYVKKYCLDGFMVGRAILSNPWFFTGGKGSTVENDLDGVSVQERIDILIKHLELFEATWGDSKPFNSQKKYIKAYVNNFKRANELRKNLMETENIDNVIEVLDNFNFSVES
jgi:tRNA-dihydrouridine synthase